MEKTLEVSWVLGVVFNFDYLNSIQLKWNKKVGKRLRSKDFLVMNEVGEKRGTTPRTEKNGV